MNNVEIFESPAMIALKKESIENFVNRDYLHVNKFVFSAECLSG